MTLNKLKSPKWSKRLPKLHMNQSIFSITYIKSFEVKQQFDHHWLQILPNHSQCYDSSCEILRFVNIVRDKLYETFSIFYHNLHVWYHHIMTNLMIFKLRLLFLEFKNHLATRSWSCSWTRCPKFLFIPLVKPHTRLNNMNIIFLLILFYYLNHLQFKFDLYEKNPRNTIN